MIYVLFPTSAEMTGSGGMVVVAPPSKVKYWVEIDGVCLPEADETAASLLLANARVARGSCLQKLVKDGESLKPSYREHVACFACGSARGWKTAGSLQADAALEHKATAVAAKRNLMAVCGNR